MAYTVYEFPNVENKKKTYLIRLILKNTFSSSNLVFLQAVFLRYNFD
jgi:hypothetical protein